MVCTTDMNNSGDRTSKNVDKPSWSPESKLMEVSLCVFGGVQQQNMVGNWSQPEADMEEEQKDNTVHLSSL